MFYLFYHFNENHKTYIVVLKSRGNKKCKLILSVGALVLKGIPNWNDSFFLFLQPLCLSYHHPVLKMAFNKYACFWVATTTSHEHFLKWILPCLPRVLIFLELIYSSSFLHHFPSSVSPRSLHYRLQRFNCGFLTKVTLILQFFEVCLNYFKTHFIDWPQRMSGLFVFEIALSRASK